MFFGLKTVALFDVWSFEHFLSGMSVGLIVINYIRKSFKKYNIKNIDIFKIEIVFLLFLCYLWEVLEHYLETGLLGNSIEYWFQGVEYFANRFIADILVTIFGYLISKKFNNLVLYARILSVIFLIIHIFIFPHSMYLHYLLK